MPLKLDPHQIYFHCFFSASCFTDCFTVATAISSNRYFSVATAISLYYIHSHEIQENPDEI